MQSCRICLSTAVMPSMDLLGSLRLTLCLMRLARSPAFVFARPTDSHWAWRKAIYSPSTSSLSESRFVQTETVLPCQCIKFLYTGLNRNLSGILQKLSGSHNSTANSSLNLCWGYNILDEYSRYLCTSTYIRKIYPSWRNLDLSLGYDFPWFAHHNFAVWLIDKVKEWFYCNWTLRGCLKCLWVDLLERHSS
jgi:hypothetical protein